MRDQCALSSKCARRGISLRRAHLVMKINRGSRKAQTGQTAWRGGSRTRKLPRNRIAQPNRLPIPIQLNYSTLTLQLRPLLANMLSRSTFRASTTTALVARRGFQSTRAQLSSPYHYPEGPRSNIPFNPLTKWFALRYWSFMAVGFGAPFGVAVWQTKKNKP